jgi:hypothetical protein
LAVLQCFFPFSRDILTTLEQMTFYHDACDRLLATKSTALQLKLRLSADFDDFYMNYHENNLP